MKKYLDKKIGDSITIINNKHCGFNAQATIIGISRHRHNSKIIFFEVQNNLLSQVPSIYTTDRYGKQQSQVWLCKRDEIN